MLKIDRYAADFPGDLIPTGNDTFDKEPFSTWWTRHGYRFPELDPRVVEQWIFRHTTHSDYHGLDFFKLKSRLETWDAGRILRDVFCADPLNPVHDYEVFNVNGETSTARPINATGTWDYPIVVLETPEGFCDNRGQYPDVRYLLIEGHLRRRYLAAKLARGEANAEHDLFILSQTD